VVKKDIVVHGMLKDEMERCERLAASLEAAIKELPKGSLHERKVRSKKRDLVYHYLKFREGPKSIYKHVPGHLVADLVQQIDQRRKNEKNLRQFNSRIKYLKKLLKAGMD
jgi:hypothetical protein